MQPNLLLIQTPIGEMLATSTQKGIDSLRFLLASEQNNYSSQTDCRFLKQLKQELLGYLQGEATHFTVPLDINGTDFQKKVWKALQQIPHGKTISYKELAQKINQPKAARAVGGANNKNKLLVLVPCHRVIGANKKLVGYAGGLDKKKWLLETEQKFV